MDTFLLGNIAFLYAFNKVKPRDIVDKCIEMILDVIVPGRSAGESHWFMRSIRSMEQSAERTSREIDIRTKLVEWDREFPFLHHELLIRYAAGFLAGFVVSNAYEAIRDSLFGRSNNYRHRRP